MSTDSPILVHMMCRDTCFIDFKFHDISMLVCVCVRVCEFVYACVSVSSAAIGNFWVACIWRLNHQHTHINKHLRTHTHTHVTVKERERGEEAVRAPSREGEKEVRRVPFCIFNGNRISIGVEFHHMHALVL